MPLPFNDTSEGTGLIQLSETYTATQIGSGSRLGRAPESAGADRGGGRVDASGRGLRVSREYRLRRLRRRGQTPAGGDGAQEVFIQNLP
jgi:hypothetical protein